MVYLLSLLSGLPGGVEVLRCWVVSQVGEAGAIRVHDIDLAGLLAASSELPRGCPVASTGSPFPFSLEYAVNPARESPFHDDHGVVARVLEEKATLCEGMRNWANQRLGSLYAAPLEARTLLYPKNVSAARYRLSGTVFVSPVASASETVTISLPRSATIWPHSPFLTASAALRP